MPTPLVSLEPLWQEVLRASWPGLAGGPLRRVLHQWGLIDEWVSVDRVYEALIVLQMYNKLYTKESLEQLTLARMLKQLYGRRIK